MLILDRYEGDIAVIESDGDMIQVSRELVSPGVREGDVLIESEGIYRTDMEGTELRRRKISELQESLWE